MTLDAAIIGGGPAGVAAAVSLRQLMPGAAVAIFDSGTGSQWRPGEILSPGAAPILKSLGCWSAFHAHGFPESFGTRAAWGAPEPYDNEFLFSLRGNGWRLDRARFDEMLRQSARDAGVELYAGTTLLDSRAEGSGWKLQFRWLECHARFVIDASGRTAAFAAQRGVRRVADDRLAGAIVLFESTCDLDTLVEAVENGWWYSAAIPGSVSVAAFMTDTDLIRGSHLHQPAKWHEMLARSTHTRLRLLGMAPKGPPNVFAAHSQRLSCTGGPGWVAAGDAAMAFDPLSSLGILKALRSGKTASFVAADFLLHKIESHGKYEQLTGAEYAAYGAAKSEYYGMELRWPEAVFWKRRR